MKFLLFFIFTLSFYELNYVLADSIKLLYEENSNGEIICNKFPKIHELGNIEIKKYYDKLKPDIKACNTSGKFMIYGDCSLYLECIMDNHNDNKFITKIFQCPKEYIFSIENDKCEIKKSKYCMMGHQVANPSDINKILESCENVNDFQIFTLSDYSGYYTCHKVYNGIIRNTYKCDKNYLWNGNSCIKLKHFHQPCGNKSCQLHTTPNECYRICKAGDKRICKYQFVIENFGSMTKYCKNCPFVQSDCDNTGCIPAGGMKRSLFSINRMSPGPAIQVCKGDDIEVEVTNSLSSESISIHWHGLHLKNTPYMDGVPHITQCPINPGFKFIYRFNADVSGTHMYHSHSGGQEADGFNGALIVRDIRINEAINSRYDRDLPEHFMLIKHLYDHNMEHHYYKHQLLGYSTEGYAILINGKGQSIKYTNHQGQLSYTPIEIFHVKTGLKYRFRLIFNSGIDCPIQFSIDQHLLDIITLDGRPIKPMDLMDSVLISGGERVDLVPHIKPGIHTENSTFYIKMRGLNECDDNGRVGVWQIAELRYDNSNKSPIQAVNSYMHSIRSGKIFNTPRNLPSPPDMHPIIGIPLIKAKDADTINPRYTQTPNKIFFIDIRYNVYSDNSEITFPYPTLNNISFIFPSYPILTQNDTNHKLCPIEKHPDNCINNHCKCTSVISVNKDDLVEIVLYDVDGFEIGHPFHMHGYAFKVVALSTLNGLITLERMKDINKSIVKKYDGPMKDTLLVPGFGFAIIRFIADNPGYWLFHCHLSEHMAQGMTTMLKVGNFNEFIKPPDNFPKCNNFI